MQAAEQMYEENSIIAEVIAFAIDRPQRVFLSEIVIRPSGQVL